MKKKKQKFMRTDAHKYSKLGVRRKKKQIYRKAKGIDNKLRLKMKGHLRNVSIGFRNKKKERGLIKGLKPVRVFNIEDLKEVSEKEIGIIANIGDKKRKEILDYAIKHNVTLNLNVKKTLEKIERKLKERELEKIEKEQKKIEQNKKAKKAAEKKTKEEQREKKKSEKETKEEMVKHETDIKANVEEKK